MGGVRTQNGEFHEDDDLNASSLDRKCEFFEFEVCVSGRSSMEPAQTLLEHYSAFHTTHANARE